jgi:ribosome-interacting GTPase 1
MEISNSKIKHTSQPIQTDGIRLNKRQSRVLYRYCSKHGISVSQAVEQALKFLLFIMDH